MLATLKGLFQFDLENQALTKIPLPEYQNKINAVLYDPISQKILVGTEIGVFISSDSGKTWKSKIEGLPQSPTNVLARNQTRLLCGTRTGLFVSENKGKNWTKCNGVYPIDITTVRANPFNANQVVAADSVANYLFRSEDGGIFWEAIDLGIKRSSIISFAFSSLGELLAGTISEGVYKIKQPQSNQLNN